MNYIREGLFSEGYLREMLKAFLGGKGVIFRGKGYQLKFTLCLKITKAP